LMSYIQLNNNEDVTKKAIKTWCIPFTSSFSILTTLVVFYINTTVRMNQLEHVNNDLRDKINTIISDYKSIMELCNTKKTFESQISEFYDTADMKISDLKKSTNDVTMLIRSSYGVQNMLTQSISQGNNYLNSIVQKNKLLGDVSSNITRVLSIINITSNLTGSINSILDKQSTLEESFYLMSQNIGNIQTNINSCEGLLDDNMHPTCVFTPAIYSVTTPNQWEYIYSRNSVIIDLNGYKQQTGQDYDIFTPSTINQYTVWSYSSSILCYYTTYRNPITVQICSFCDDCFLNYTDDTTYSTYKNFMNCTVN